MLVAFFAWSLFHPCTPAQRKVASPVLVGRRYRWSAQWSLAALQVRGRVFPTPRQRLSPIICAPPLTGMRARFKPVVWIQSPAPIYICW